MHSQIFRFAVVAFVLSFIIVASLSVIHHSEADTSSAAAVLAREEALVVEEPVVPEVPAEVEVEPVLEVPVQPSVLASTSWQWSQTIYADSTVVAPTDPRDFVISFTATNRVQATTDCNLVSGSFTASSSVFSTESLTATKMACDEESQEEVFVADLRRVTGFELNEGELVLLFPGESGLMVFEAVE